MTRTHEVLNQVPPLVDYDVFSTDVVLKEAVAREQAGWAADRLHALGRLAGGEALAWGIQANRHPPELHAFDRFGHRVDEVEFHPAWHLLMGAAVEHGLHASPWVEPRPGAHVARAAGFFLLTQAEAGFGCPISMTYSAVPALRASPAVAQQWEPRLGSRAYDPRNKPAAHKRGALCGMAMTEKQGGSDVRANTTRATPNGDGSWSLLGHKWFCSAPMCDLFLVLAQTGRGVSCFAVPRWQPDGVKNRMHLMRLKDKLGNKSNASSEVEFDGAWGELVGEEGRGVPTILNMVSHTRLDCCIGAAAGMRAAVTQALHHASHRAAFGKRLVDHALMQNVLCDLALESEAATATMARLARAYDEQAAGNEEARNFARLATAVCKYWLCKRAPVHAAEALECLGGNGYVEESAMPRLYREAPLNGIWEGSGNVICLDVLRAMAREPETVQPFFDEVLRAREPRLERAVEAVRGELGDGEALEPRARRVVERLALVLQASLLLRHAPAAVAEAFLASRIDGDRGMAFGTLPRGVDADAILGRAALQR